MPNPLRTCRDLSLNGFRLLNLRLEMRSSPPSSPASGTTYFDTTLDAVQVWTGSEWQQLSSSAQQWDQYEESVGDGVTSEFTVTHNLNTRNVFVICYETGAPYEQVMPTVRHTSPDSVTITFGSAPSANQYQIVVGTKPL